MAKLRFVQIEGDFASEDIRVLAGIMGGQVATAPAAPVIVEPALLAPPSDHAAELPNAAHSNGNGNGHKVRRGRPPKLAPEPSAKKTRAAKPAKEAAGGAPAEGSTRDLILQQIKKRPMSSLELMQALKREDVPHQIYQACSALKSAGLVNSGIDDNDGTRRWSLAA